MNCAQCGSLLPESIIHCSICGAAVIPPQPMDNQGTPAVDDPAIPSTKRGNRSVKKILLAFGIILLAFVCYYAYSLPRLIQRSKIKRTVGDMTTVAIALENMFTDGSQYPLGNTLDQLYKSDTKKNCFGIVPDYLGSPILIDAWGHEYRYYGVPLTNSNSTAAGSYIFASAGPDGKWEYDELIDYLGPDAKKYQSCVAHAYKTGEDYRISNKCATLSGDRNKISNCYAEATSLEFSEKTNCEIFQINDDTWLPSHRNLGDDLVVYNQEFIHYPTDYPPDNVHIPRVKEHNGKK